MKLLIHLSQWAAILLSLAACQPQVPASPTVSPQPTAALQTVGIVLSSEVDSLSPLGSSTDIVRGRGDIPPELIVTEQRGHILFSCGITRGAGRVRQTIPRLCHALPDGALRVVKPHAYAVPSGWSLDGDWLVFAGAASGSAMICQQRLYAYQVDTRELVNLMPDFDERVCGLRQGLQWEEITGQTWLTFEAWTGGDQQDATSYVFHRLLFDPPSGRR